MGQEFDPRGLLFKENDFYILVKFIQIPVSCWWNLWVFKMCISLMKSFPIFFKRLLLDRMLNSLQYSNFSRMPILKLTNNIFSYSKDILDLPACKMQFFLIILITCLFVVSFNSKWTVISYSHIYYWEWKVL